MSNASDLRAMEWVAAIQHFQCDMSGIESGAHTYRQVMDVCPDDLDLEVSMRSATEQQLHKKIGAHAFVLVSAAYAYALESIDEPVPREPQPYRILSEGVTFFAPVMPSLAHMTYMEASIGEVDVSDLHEHGLGMVAKVCTEEELEQQPKAQMLNRDVSYYGAIAVPFNGNLVSVAPLHIAA